MIAALKDHVLGAPTVAREGVHQLLSCSGGSPSPAFGWHCWMKTAFVELMQEKREQAVVSVFLFDF